MTAIPTPDRKSEDLVLRVDTALKGSPHLSGRQVFCQAEAGVIVLHGRVDSFFQKQMAQEVLRKLDGVEAIINELEVDWMKSVTL